MITQEKRHAEHDVIPHVVDVPDHYKALLQNSLKKSLNIRASERHNGVY